MVKINKEKCSGCGVCVNVCPEGIKMESGKAEIKNENTACLKDAASACPDGAILFDEGNSNNTNLNENYTQDGWTGRGRGMGNGKGRGFGNGLQDGRGNGRGGGQGRGRRRW